MEKKLTIVHETHYAFDSEVFIEPHYFRFQPRVSSVIQVINFDLKISPYPLTLSGQFDAESNQVHFAWFEGLHTHLSVKVRSQVILQDNNPFDFILYPQTYLELPFQYSDRLTTMLTPALASENISDELVAYVDNILSGSGFKTLNFLTNLTNQIHSDFELEFRLEGQPYAADTTFEMRKGSCRDLSWMQIQMLRHLGIASRFVSGYFYINTLKNEFELHAWIEVYLPGAGWIGFDPSHGIIVGNNHIPVCTSSHHKNAMPITGTIRGKANSVLTTSIALETCEGELNEIHVN